MAKADSENRDLTDQEFELTENLSVEFQGLKRYQGAKQLAPPMPVGYKPGDTSARADRI